MGCDIHLYAERRGEYGWELVTPFEVGMNPTRFGWLPYGGGFYDHCCYPLFAQLADIRQSGEPVQPIDRPRGMPDDASDAVQAMEAWQHGDAHSHSWITLNEARSLPPLPAAYLWSPWPPSEWTLMCVALSTLPDPVRLVFWFDN